LGTALPGAGYHIGYPTGWILTLFEKKLARGIYIGSKGLIVCYHWLLSA
jgi:hypothetical protein